MRDLLSPLARTTPARRVLVAILFGLLRGVAAAGPIDAQIPIGSPSTGCPSCLGSTTGTASITYNWTNSGDSFTTSGTVPATAKVLYYYWEALPSGFGFLLGDIYLSHGGFNNYLVFRQYSDGSLLWPFNGFAWTYPFKGQTVNDGTKWHADPVFRAKNSSYRCTATLVVAYEVPQPTPPPAPKPDFNLEVYPGSGELAAGGASIQLGLFANYVAGPSGFAVDLSMVNPPNGFSIQLSHTSVGVWSNMTIANYITISALQGTAAGTYWFQVKGRTSDPIERFATFSIVVLPFPKGNFESLSTSGVASGWLFDPNVPTVSTDALVYVSQPSGPPLTFSAPTSLLRSDVNSTYGITGNHGFSFAIPSSLLGTSRQVWIWGHGATPAGGGQIELPGSGKWYCAASAGDLYGTGSCSNRCVKAVPPSGNGYCQNDCDCGNPSSGKYCYLGPNSCVSTTLLTKPLSGSQSIPFTGGTTWTAINNSSSSFSFASAASRNVTVSFNYQFDFPTGFSWMTLNVRLLVDGVEVARDTGVTRGSRTFTRTVGPIVTGSHVLSFEVQSILSSGPPITTTIYPGTINATLVRN